VTFTRLYSGILKRRRCGDTRPIRWAGALRTALVPLLQLARSRFPSSDGTLHKSLPILVQMFTRKMHT
jgi:hypothetical protein